MSVINKMLQELDARRAAHGVSVRLPDDVRPLPAAPPSRWPLVSALVAASVLLVGLVLVTRELGQEAASRAIPTTVPALVAALPQTPAETNATSAEKAAAVSSPAGADELVTPEANPHAGELRLAASLETPVNEAAARPAAPRRASTAITTGAESLPDNARSVAERRPRVTGEAPRRSALVPAASASAKASAPPSIEKTDSVASPRDRAEAAYRKAIATLNQGRLDEAFDALHKALREDELHIGARQLLVKLLLESARSEEAVQVLQEGLHGQPAQIGWAMSLARLQADRGDLAAAWQTLDNSAPAAGNNADYQGFSAHVLQRLARNKEAAAHYLAATRLAPGDGRWWLGLGLALDADGRSGEAHEAFLRARQSGTLNADLAAMVEQKLR